MRSAGKKIVWGCSISMLMVVALVGLWFLNFRRTHRHCIKISGTAFRDYALAHNGKFPFHTNGFGDALLLLVKEDVFDAKDTTGDYTVPFVIGPGDDGKMLKEALKTGADVPEEKCSRVYVQGLSETNNPNIAILFDKVSTRGGDHFRRPWGPLLREVCLLDGSMKTVREEEWSRFATNQIELLVEAGIRRATAESYYRIR